MMARLHRVGLLVVFTLICFTDSLWSQGTDTAERILFNAKVFTGVPEHPYAEAVAIHGDKIMAVGSFAEVLQAAGKNAERVDLGGKSLLPGLIDSHIHAIYGGLTLTTTDVGDQLQSMDQLLAIIQDGKKSGKGMRGDVLRVSGMPLSYWSKLDELNARFNSGAFADQAVFLKGSDGHTGWANRVLLRRAGITKDFLSHLSPSERAYYGIGADGESNGFAVDAGLDKIEALVPQPSEEQLLEGGRAAVHYLHSLGITGWLDAMAEPPVLATYRSLAQHGDLTAHVAAFPVVNPRNDPAKELEFVQKVRQEYAGIQSDIAGYQSFRRRRLEFPSQTASLTKPYRNKGTRRGFVVRSCTVSLSWPR